MNAQRASGGKPGRHSSDEKKFVRRRQENAGREDVGVRMVGGERREASG